MSAPLDRQSVFEAINSIFTSMLGLELQASDGNPATPPGGIKVTASVGLVGDWNGTAILECSGEMACILASAMLMADYRQVDEDVQDVIGEITNMFAGNVSRLLPGSHALSPPCVVQGTQYSMDILRTRVAVNLPLICNGRHLVASVVEGGRRRGS